MYMAPLSTNEKRFCILRVWGSIVLGQVSDVRTSSGASAIEGRVMVRAARILNPLLASRS